MASRFKVTPYLKNLYETQVLKKYYNGDYKYKAINYYPQIEIVIDLKTNKGIVHIKSGWSLFPNGEIKLSTTFLSYVKYRE